MPASNVITDRHKPLADGAGEGRPDHGVGQRLLRHRHARACAEQRLILLGRAVAGHLVLALGGFQLGAPLFELRLGEQLVVVEPLGAGKLAARQLVGGLRIRHFGHSLGIEGSVAGHGQPRLDLRDVRLRLAGLRFHFGGGDLDERVVGTHQAARSTGVATMRPAISAATSASSCGVSVPLTRMNRINGSSTAAAADTVIATASGERGIGVGAGATPGRGTRHDNDKRK